MSLLIDQMKTYDGYYDTVLSAATTVYSAAKECRKAYAELIAAECAVETAVAEAERIIDERTLARQQAADMNNPHLIASLLAIAPSFLLAAAPIQAESPCIFTVRLMDAAHIAFDTNRVASLAVYDASGKKIAAAKTFFRADSRRNYALTVPMASAPVDGAASPGAVVSVEVTEPNGEVWTGVVVDSDATLGGPGSVKEVDIVLAKCTNNEYGLDDDLYNDLYWAWRYSAYYDAASGFDPNADHDGDGISTINEVMAGSNPFDPDSKLAIVDYLRDDVAGDGLTFTANPARSYSVESTTNLDAKAWKQLPFTTGDSLTEQSVISCPSTMRSGTLTILLKPAEGASRFYRIKSE